MNLVPIFQKEQETPDSAWLLDVTQAEATSEPGSMRVRIAAEKALFVTSADLTRALEARHDNVLRQLRSFAREHGRDRTSSQDAGCDGFDPLKSVAGLRLVRMGSKVRMAYITLPALHAFIKWLIESLKGHEGTLARRREQFIKWLGPWSGLVPLSAVAPADNLSAAGRVLGLLKEKWPEAVDQDHLIFASEAAQDQFDLSVLFTAGPSDIVALSVLANRLGYSEKQLQRRLLAARAEYAGANEHDSFLKVQQDGHGLWVDYKTAMFIIQAMPRAVHTRLKVFNILFERQRKTYPLLLQIDDPAQTVDCSEPQEAYRALQRMQCRLVNIQNQHTRQLAELQDKYQKADADRRLTQAAHTGTLMEVASLKGALHNVTAAGAVVPPSDSDAFIHSSAELRSAHNLVTIQDVSALVLRHYGAEQVSKWFSGCQGGDMANLRKVIRYFVGYKFLAADGAPVLRPETVANNVARRFRVYVTGNSSAGHRAAHGTEKTWQWSVFYTQEGVRLITEQMSNLVEAWWQADRPNHMCPRNDAVKMEE